MAPDHTAELEHVYVASLPVKPWSQNTRQVLLTVRSLQPELALTRSGTSGGHMSAAVQSNHCHGMRCIKRMHVVMPLLSRRVLYPGGQSLQ